MKASLFHLCKSLSADICKIHCLEIQHKIAWTPHVFLDPFKHGPSRIPKASPRVALASLGSQTESFSSFFLGTKGALKRPRKFPPFPYLREMKTSRWRRAEIISLDAARIFPENLVLSQPWKCTMHSQTLPATCAPLSCPVHLPHHG